MSILNQVVTGAKMKPLAVLVYADRGLGKTTFPMKAPSPIYVTCEENDEYDIPRLPKVEKWQQLKDQLKAIRDDKHTFKTLVIDTADTLEKVAQTDVILTGKNKELSMAHAHGGFGKAYEVQAKMFNEILTEYLIPIRDKRNMNVVILAHSEKKKHECPITNTSYDSFSVAMHKTHRPAYENWVSAILFISYDLLKQTRSDGKEVVEGLDGKRVIYTEERPAHTAKNRFELPYEMEFDKDTAWEEFSKLVKEYYATQAKRITADKKEEPVKQIAKEEVKTPPPAEELTPDVADKIETNSEIIEHQKKIDELWPKVPEELKGAIGTSLKRGIAKQDAKEILRILNKIKSIVNVA